MSLTNWPTFLPCPTPTSIADLKCIPPYTLLIVASFAAALKEEKDRTGSPYFTSESSSKAKLSPKMDAKTIDAAPETTECPLVYSGKGGVCKIGFHSLLK